MNHKPNDLLLLAGKVLAIFMQGAMAFGAVILILVSGVLIFFHDTALAEIAQETGVAEGEFPIFAVVGIMLIGLAIVSALFVFFGKLRQIIGTVGEGDPFQPANADRLSMMGWLMFGVQLAVLPAAPLGIQIANFADKVEGSDVNIDGGFSLDFTGILIVVLLFILARVFKHGAAMREDLEGTV